MKRSIVEGLIEWKILINYKVELGVLQRFLPQPFFPRSIRGFGLVGIAVTKQKGLRSVGVPLSVGFSSMIVEHQIAASWENAGKLCHGLYIPRRDTSSLLQMMVGDRLSGGMHHLSRIRARIRYDRYTLGMRSIDQQGVKVQLMAKLTDRFPMGSVMKELETAVDFFESGKIAYSPLYKKSVFEGIAWQAKDYSIQPLRVERLNGNYWEELAGFPAKSVFFDHALLIQGAPHQWNHIPELIAPRPYELSNNKVLLEK
ncbi:MAG: hypothetical protein AAF587_02160 [Bacteroidota bacterium]